MSFGSTLRAAREARGMRLRAFASALGVSPAFLSLVERDQATLSEDRTRAAAALLEVDSHELDAERGLTRELAAWIASDPDLVTLLRTSRATGRRLRLE